MSMDTAQITNFCEFLTGSKPIGVSQDEELSVPHSPELRAFCLARIGDQMPSYGWSILHRIHRAQALALASMLQEVVDGLRAAHQDRAAIAKATAP